MTSTTTEPSTYQALALLPNESVDESETGARFVLACVYDDYDPTDPTYLIVGRVEVDESGVEFLGCMTCGGEISRVDAGMCLDCREDAAFAEQVNA